MTELEGEANNRAYYDDFSDGYERERAKGYHRMLDDLEMQVVAPLARGKRVLEVGCGTGLILGRLARHAALARGVDLSPGMLQAARARGRGTQQPTGGSQGEFGVHADARPDVLEVGRPGHPDRPTRRPDRTRRLTDPSRGRPR